MLRAHPPPTCFPPCCYRTWHFRSDKKFLEPSNRWCWTNKFWPFSDWVTAAKIFKLWKVICSFCASTFCSIIKESVQKIPQFSCIHGTHSGKGFWTAFSQSDIMLTVHNCLTAHFFQIIVKVHLLCKFWWKVEVGEKASKAGHRRNVKSSSKTDQHQTCPREAAPPSRCTVGKIWDYNCNIMIPVDLKHALQEISKAEIWFRRGWWRRILTEEMETYLIIP